MMATFHFGSREVARGTKTAGGRWRLHLAGWTSLTAVAILLTQWNGFGQPVALPAGDSQPVRLAVPRLLMAPHIDGDLSDWKDAAFSDGVWDIQRLRHAPWYQAARNRLTDHGREPDAAGDLEARYFIAWDERHVYLGAEVHDNVNDVDDPAHEDKRWYFKDCIAWFIEAPRDDKSEEFGAGDHAFCFVIDGRKPAYGAWWRHGTVDRQYVEEPLPAGSFDYQIRFDPWGRGKADFVLEARVALSPTLGKSDPAWKPPAVGDEYGLEIVHTDPDGGGYGGHFIIYGTGDDDATWGRMALSGPQEPIRRLSE